MSHRHLRALRSLTAAAALVLAALVVPQAASGGTTVTPTTATVVVRTDPALASSLGDVPDGALPQVLAAVGTPVQVEVSLTGANGAAASYSYDTAVTLAADGPGALSTTTGIIPAYASSARISTSYSKASAAVTITATVRPARGHASTPPLAGSAAPFAVDLKLTLLGGQDPSLLNGTAGADAAGCAVVNAAHPMCGILSLPRGASGGTALSLGLCPTGAACTPGALVTQFLGDLTDATGADLYTRTAPASMAIICDKTLCGGSGVSSYRALWSTTATGALVAAPPCPATGVIGADQDFCTDLVASSRLNAGDLRLVVLFLTDVRGTI